MPQLTPSDIVEAIIDQLVVGEDFADVPSIHVDRTGPGSLLLDYGTAGVFVLTVEPREDA
jgi:hypothetical protein